MTNEHQPASVTEIIPPQPIDRISQPIERFIHVQTTGGIVLLAATATAIISANSPFADSYLAIWNTKLGVTLGAFEFTHSLKHLINDALMVIFFFVIGLEVKREFVLGELRDRQKAIFPIVAALGGMIVPALLYLAFQSSGDARSGWGIPMATDIAFVVGCMAMLGTRVPSSLRVMLLTLAIADDIGAILVIAVGYSNDLQLFWLAMGVFGIGVVVLLARSGVRHFLPYVLLGVFIWYGFHESGVHATIAGVILGLLTPARNYIKPELFANAVQRAGELLTGEEWDSMEHRADRLRRFQWAARETISPLEYLEALLHPWVAFLVLPLFALANAGVPLSLSAMQSTTAIAVAVGLVIGKPLGIFGASRLAVMLGLAKTPECGWPMIVAGGCLAGIGFTMSLFIAELALTDDVLANAKVGVLFGSVASAVIGTLLILLLQHNDESSAVDRTT